MDRTVHLLCTPYYYSLLTTLNSRIFSLITVDLFCQIEYFFMTFPDDYCFSLCLFPTENGKLLHEQFSRLASSPSFSPVRLQIRIITHTFPHSGKFLTRVRASSCFLSFLFVHRKKITRVTGEATLNIATRPRSIKLSDQIAASKLIFFRKSSSAL